jgi:hypothetical protein
VSYLVAREFLRKDAVKLRILSVGTSVGSPAVALRTKIMAIQAETVEILVEKARFEPKIALAVAEAIEFEMTHAQFVTVPILDARIHEVRAEIRVLEGKIEGMEAKIEAKLEGVVAKIEAKLAAMEAKLVRWVFLVMLGNVALSVAATTVFNAFKAL